MFRFWYLRVTETFDGDDFRAIRAWCRHETGHDRLAVQEDGASSALALGAAFLCAGQPGLLPQQSQQRLFVAAGERVFFAINFGMDGGPNDG